MREGSGEGLEQFGKGFRESQLLHLTGFKINCNKRETKIKTQTHFGCGNFSVIGPLRGQPGRYGYKCLFCQSYRCNRCRNPKLKKVRARIAEIATEHKLQRMATLTLDPKRIPKRERTDRYIRECWRKMRVLLARQYGGSLAFVGVLEFQKNGNAHLHVLLGRYIPQAWLSRAWQSIGGGRVADIRYVDVHRVSAYLAVYLAGDKVQHTLDNLAKRARIFTTARSIVLWGKKKASGWKLRRMDLSFLHGRAENPSGERFTAIEDLKAFNLQLLSYFESPICPAAFGSQDVLHALRDAVPFWNEKVSPEISGEVVKTQVKGESQNG